MLDMVLDTPFDFTSMRKIGAEISSKNDQLSFGNGYDHNFVLNQYIKDLFAKHWFNRFIAIES